MLTLLDWKSSSFLAPEMRLQLGAYASASHYFDPDRLCWMPMPWRVASAGIVQVRPEGTKLALCLEGEELAEASRLFGLALEVFHYFVRVGAFRVPEREEYRVGDRQLVSVTYTLQHIIAKPGLLSWYAKMAREGKNPNDLRDQRAAAGSRLHKNLLFFLEGKLVDLTYAPDELVQAITGFERWSRSVSLEPVWTERRVANPALGWAGTLDCVAKVSWNGKEEG